VKQLSKDPAELSVGARSDLRGYFLMTEHAPSLSARQSLQTVWARNQAAGSDSRDFQPEELETPKKAYILSKVPTTNKW
jgi:hypothetical protein